MNLAAGLATALKEGGPAAGVLILFYTLGWFDLPMPGKLPSEAAIAKPLLALLGALAAYKFLPRRKGRRYLAVLAVFAAGAASFWFYRHYNDVPAPPALVDVYVTRAANRARGDVFPHGRAAARADRHASCGAPHAEAALKEGATEVFPRGDTSRLPTWPHNLFPYLPPIVSSRHLIPFFLQVTQLNLI